MALYEWDIDADGLTAVESGGGLTKKVTLVNTSGVTISKGWTKGTIKLTPTEGFLEMNTGNGVIKTDGENDHIEILIHPEDEIYGEGPFDMNDAGDIADAVQAFQDMLTFWYSKYQNPSQTFNLAERELDTNYSGHKMYTKMFVGTVAASTGTTQKTILMANGTFTHAWVTFSELNGDPFDKLPIGFNDGTIMINAYLEFSTGDFVMTVKDWAAAPTYTVILTYTKTG